MLFRSMYFKNDALRTALVSGVRPAVGQASAPVATGGAAAGLDQLGAMLGALVAPHVAAKVDREDVAAMIDAALSKRPSTRVEVVRGDGSSVKVEGQHKAFPAVVRALGAGVHVFMVGPAGSGKTTLAEKAAESLGKSFRAMSEIGRAHV